MMHGRLPSHSQPSLLIGRYQIILLDDRGTCVRTTWPGSLLESAEAWCRTRDLLIATPTAPQPSMPTRNVVGGWERDVIKTWWRKTEERSSPHQDLHNWWVDNSIFHTLIVSVTVINHKWNTNREFNTDRYQNDHIACSLHFSMPRRWLIFENLLFTIKWKQQIPVMWSETVGLRTRSDWDQKIGLGLAGLVLRNKVLLRSSS